MQNCSNGHLNQLWSKREDDTIRRAFSAQCLDSNDAGAVYWLECNGGRYQKWIHSGTKLQNAQTGGYLQEWYWGTVITTRNRIADDTDWVIGGGS